MYLPSIIQMFFKKCSQFPLQYFPFGIMKNSASIFQLRICFSHILFRNWKIDLVTYKVFGVKKNCSWANISEFWIISITNITKIIQNTSVIILTTSVANVSFECSGTQIEISIMKSLWERQCESYDLSDIKWWMNNFVTKLFPNIDFGKFLFASIFYFEKVWILVF